MTLAHISRHPGRKRKVAVTLPSWDGPTPERLRHAQASGHIAVTDSFRTDAGAETQLKRRRFVSPLEVLWKSGEIDAGQYGAARRYQRDADLAAIAGPASAMSYTPRYIDDVSDPDLLPIEAAANYLLTLAKAQQACGAKARRMLDWIAAEPMGWRQQAQVWHPRLGKPARERHFRKRLREICTALEGHYSALQKVS